MSQLKAATGLIILGIATAHILRSQTQVQAEAGGVVPDHRTILVELFTSEGCSSCPPADALLRQIDGKQTADGRRIIGISEHVTYWNHLGWSDPFSNDAYTQRQDVYRIRFNLESVYTPQMVINGEDEFVGSDRRLLQKELEKSQNSQTLAIQINSIVAERNEVNVRYALSGKLPSGGADIVAVIADDEVRSNVARGENSGRILTHVAVARTMKRIAAALSPQDQALEIQTAHIANTPPKQSRRLILFVQAKGQGRVLGADEKSF
jgi:hypothetical protein